MCPSAPRDGNRKRLGMGTAHAGRQKFVARCEIVAIVSRAVLLSGASRSFWPLPFTSKNPSRVRAAASGNVTSSDTRKPDA